MIRMTRKSNYWLLMLLLSSATVSAEGTFPQPPELKPDVDFWVSIFSRYDSSEGVLHDNRNLAVVYERVDFSANTGRRDRQRRIKSRRDSIAAILRNLANGDRDGLNAEEARILALWPDDVSNATLQAAAGRIRFQQGLSDRFRQGLRRSGRWRAFIEAEFADLGVPAELAALPHVESSYNPAARSHVGASGIWQFTRSTGRRFMQVDHVLDERNDPFEATRGAGRLLAYNYSIAGNWPMAITAYNHGLSGVRRAQRAHGDTAYVEILREYRGRTFGFASRNFYVAFLAAMEIDQNQDKYFPGVVPDQPTDYAEASLPGYLPAGELAAALGVSEREIAAHNLAWQATIWQGSKHVPRGTNVRIPDDMLDAPIDRLIANIDADLWQDEQLPDMYHTVVRGDTLSEIADAYDTRVSTLVALNALSSSNRIRVGERLRLPAAGPAPAAAEPPPEVVEPEVEVAVATAPAEAVTAEIVVEEQAPAAMVGDVTPEVTVSSQTALLSDPSDYSVADDGTIEVQPLETLGHYADWLGIRTQRLRDINGFAFRTPVEVGKRIKLDLSSVDADTFENLRVAYQRAQQDNFFQNNVITGVTEHVIRRGESIWVLSLREYDVPVWLFRQYNPGLDLHRVRPGTTVQFPTMTATDRS